MLDGRLETLKNDQWRSAKIIVGADLVRESGQRPAYAMNAGCLRLDAKKKPAQIALSGLLNKWIQPLSPGCSEESSWTVTVQDRTGETVAKKNTLRIHSWRGTETEKESAG